MGSEYERLVEDVAKTISGSGVTSPRSLTRAEAVLALIAERTKEAYEQMRAAGCDEIDAYPLEVRDCWSAMHAASALWPPRDGKKDENSA